MLYFIGKLFLSLILVLPNSQLMHSVYRLDLVQDNSRANTPAFSMFLPIVIRDTRIRPEYFVDSISGSDANPGTTPDLPWQSLEKVESTRFTPGSAINFKRGSTWTGSLLMRDSGQPGDPIIYTSYGSGQRPILRNPGDATLRTKGIVIDANWVVVQDLQIEDVFMAGVQVLRNSEHNIIRSIEVTRTGFGVVLEGQHNLVTNSYIHDLHMVKNTPGGSDDYGAIGVSVENSYNEVSYNWFINCRAPSYDFGTDGGAVEWWNIADGVSVHHNWAAGNAGFLEIGGGSARDAVVAYNVSFNNRRFAAFHITPPFSSVVENFRIENNTIVETPTESKCWDVFWFSGTPISNTVILRNNILYIDWFSTVANQSGFTHSNNLYYLSDGTKLNFELGPGEIIADPAFTDLANQNFNLLPSSPAIDAGLPLNYSLDFDNHRIPEGVAPDMGAYEYQENPFLSTMADFSLNGYSTSECSGWRGCWLDLSVFRASSKNIRLSWELAPIHR